MEINWSIVGWILGLLFVYLFGLFEGRGQGYKRRKAEEEAEKSPAPVKADDPGILRIKNERGNLTLDLDGARVNATTLTAEQRKRLIELLTLIRPWLEGKPAAAQTIPPPPPKPEPVPVQSAAPTAAPKSTPADDRPVAPANSIVGQIDSILQARLAGTPLEERGVFLAQSPEGGVIVYVGLNKYMGVDEVPDAAIKAALRAATEEWEKKYTPGL